MSLSYNPYFIFLSLQFYWNNIFFQGYVLGNPLTIRKEKNYKIPYAHGMGFISDELYEVIELYFLIVEREKERGENNIMWYDKESSPKIITKWCTNIISLSHYLIEVKLVTGFYFVVAAKKLQWRVCKCRPQESFMFQRYQLIRRGIYMHLFNFFINCMFFWSNYIS